MANDNKSAGNLTCDIRQRRQPLVHPIRKSQDTIERSKELIKRIDEPLAKAGSKSSD
jgi:hypothetical protein